MFNLMIIGTKSQCFSLTGMTTAETKSVLILEDDPLISFDACEAITEAGLAYVAAHNCTTASRILDAAGCSCAMLDFDLRGETSLPIAMKLEQNGIPYCFVTGRSVNEIVEACGLDATVYTKPANYALIAQRLLETA